AAVVAAQQFSDDGLGAPGPSLPRPNQLEAFLKEQVRRLPRAKEYFLILSGHGSGAVGDFLIDSDPTTSLSIPQLARILKGARKVYWDAYQEVEADGKTRKRIALLGMDSCLMSNAEVCYEIREDANYLVASEGFVANTGWPYHRVLEACLKPSLRQVDPVPRSVARRVARNYSLFYRDYEISGLSTDIAVCDLAKFRTTADNSLIAAIREFSNTFTRSLESAYVSDLLSETQAKLEEARAVPAALSKKIAALLLDSDRKSAGALEARLRTGSDGARRELESADKNPRLIPSQRHALQELRRAVNGRHDVEDEPLARQREWEQKANDRVRKEVEAPSTRQNALAVVRARREFDPGVLGALQLIEE